MKGRLYLLFKDLFGRRDIKETFYDILKKKAIEIILQVFKSTLFHAIYFKSFLEIISNEI
jgi:hypothetical protein